jgi:hypothetical protein
MLKTTLSIDDEFVFEKDSFRIFGPGENTSMD